jgi:hypothetical protein
MEMILKVLFQKIYFLKKEKQVKERRRLGSYFFCFLVGVAEPKAFSSCSLNLTLCCMGTWINQRSPDLNTSTPRL